MNTKKGKKINEDFVNEFISQLLEKGISNSIDIVKEAEKKIKNIDKILLNLNKIKQQRSNLIDVINSFGGNSDSKEIDKKDLSLISVPNNEIVKYVINNLLNDNLTYSDLKKQFYVKDIVPIISLLIKNKVIVKKDYNFYKGENFEKFNVLSSK